MKLALVQGLLVTTVTIRHRGRCTVVEKMVVDTGSAQTWVNVNAVEGELDLTPEGADEIVTAFGIGGRDVALRKTVDEIAFDTFHAGAFPIDVGSLGPGLKDPAIWHCVLGRRRVTQAIVVANLQAGHRARSADFTSAGTSHPR